MTFSLICVWTNGWVNNMDAGDFGTLSHSLWRHCNVWFDEWFSFYHAGKQIHVNQCPVVALCQGHGKVIQFIFPDLYIPFLKYIRFRTTALDARSKVIAVTAETAAVGANWQHKVTPEYGDLMNVIPDSKVHGANMGPTWVLSAPGVPHVGPMNLAVRDAIDSEKPYDTLTRQDD